MKTNKIIYILAAVAIVLLASCNAQNHSCEDHANHEHSVNDTIKE